ncbi:MAG: MATE family efflux transporter, partial [Lachnospiraceae bacterium]|nr:MATE family efflux transporter [Lachnospiraceae bacterium]
AGAAIATVASQLISGVLCLIYIVKRYEILHISKEEWKPDLHYMKILCSMGVPMGLQYSIIAIGSVIMQTALNVIGAMAVAATTAANKVSMFFGCPFDAMGTTMATYGGQNVGAKKIERIGQGLKACLTVGFIYWIISFIVMCIFGERLNALFVDSPDPEMMAQAQEFLLINGASFFLLALVNIVRYLIQGMGYSTFAILAGVFELVARTLAAIVLVPLFGFTGACFASPLAWVFADAFLIPAYFHVKKKLERIMLQEA